MTRRLRCAFPLALLLAVSPGFAASGDWKTDVVHLKTGRSFAGLVLEETPAEVRFQVVKRAPGRPTITLTTSFPRAEINRLDKLAGKEHDELLARLKALEGADELEDPRLKLLDLKTTGPQISLTEGRREVLHYVSDHFELFAHTSEDMARRAALRLEEIDALFTFYLPPLGRRDKPNTVPYVSLYDSTAEYKAKVKNRGRDIFNPVYYDAAENYNEILAGGDLRPLSKQFAEARRVQREQLKRLKQQAAEASQLPKGEVQDRARKQIQTARTAIVQAARQNEELVRQATQQLFRSVYHEAFHAYLVNFVFPPTRGQVPRWLNEGLAQVFEEAIAEGGELRVGHVEPARLDKAQAAARAGALVPLGELARSAAAQFVVAHGHDRQTADRYYLTAWALAHYLLSERRVIGTPALDDYLAALNGKIEPRTGRRERGADPVDALGKLVGLSLPQLEKELRQYLLRLQ